MIALVSGKKRAQLFVLFFTPIYLLEWSTMKRLLLPLILLIGTVGAPVGAFGAEEESSETLSLEEVLQQVAERNPEIAAARRQVDAAEERIPQARAFDDPQFGITRWSNFLQISTSSKPMRPGTRSPRIFLSSERGIFAAKSPRWKAE
ncbi:MAG: TolC family protein (plasmid) [Candidatus Manganitrophus sp.]|nr:MAG: TolC family protein [Candidatus Manganitrophus sp.]